MAAYLLGSVPLAYLVAKWTRGIDLRQYGSGNIGFSNLWVATSKKIAILVALFDLVKGGLMIWLAQWLGLELYQQVTIGVAAIAGHNWPIFLRFNGGRGMLTTLGVVLILLPWLGIALVVAMALMSLIIKESPLPVLISVTILPLASWLSGQSLAITLGCVAMLFIMVIRRLTAPLTPTSSSLSWGQLLINRLLFDRDIRQRKAWVHRLPPSQTTRPEKKG